MRGTGQNGCNGRTHREAERSGGRLREQERVAHRLGARGRTDPARERCSGGGAAYCTWDKFQAGMVLQVGWPYHQANRGAAPRSAGRARRRSRTGRDVVRTKLTAGGPHAGHIMVRVMKAWLSSRLLCAHSTEGRVQQAVRHRFDHWYCGQSNGAWLTRAGDEHVLGNGGCYTPRAARGNIPRLCVGSPCQSPGSLRGTCWAYVQCWSCPGNLVAGGGTRTSGGLGLAQGLHSDPMVTRKCRPYTIGAVAGPRSILAGWSTSRM